MGLMCEFSHLLEREGQPKHFRQVLARVKILVEDQSGLGVRVGVGVGGALKNISFSIRLEGYGRIILTHPSTSTAFSSCLRC